MKNIDSLSACHEGDATGMTVNIINRHSRLKPRFFYRINTVMILAVLVVFCMVSRLLFVGEYLEGWDSIDFALGLHDYDITNYQPHFPGYPVYMFLCYLVRLFTDNDTLALTIPGAVLGSVALAPLYYLARRMFDEKVAWITVFLYMVNPLCWLQSEKALSDAVGLFFIILSTQLLYYAATPGVVVLRFLIPGSMMLGISMGVRLSYFPFIILWVYVMLTVFTVNKRKMAICYGAFAFVTGISIWMIPFAWYTGSGQIITNGLGFTSGHFSDWGGSIITSQNIPSRILDFVWCLFCNGLGFWCYDTSAFRLLPSVIMGAGLILYLRHVRLDVRTKFIIVYVLPYSLWVFFGQNPEKPRHILPLIPIIIICISAGLAGLRGYGNKKETRPGAVCTMRRGGLLRRLNKYKFLSPYYLLTGTLIASMSIISTGLVYDHKRKPPAQKQLLDYVEHNYDDTSTRIYCWETKRFFEYYAPLWDARRARNIDDVYYDLESSLITPEVVLLTSMVEGIKPDLRDLKVVVRFQNDRYINNPYHRLTLYRLMN